MVIGARSDCLTFGCYLCVIIGVGTDLNQKTQTVLIHSHLSFVKLSEGCFIFGLVSLSLEVARPIYPNMCTKVAIKKSIIVGIMPGDLHITQEFIYVLTMFSRPKLSNTFMAFFFCNRVV